VFVSSVWPTSRALRGLEWTLVVPRARANRTVVESEYCIVKNDVWEVKNREIKTEESVVCRSKS
jgi:hypothetical protein